MTKMLRTEAEAVENFKKSEMYKNLNIIITHYGFTQTVKALRIIAFTNARTFQGELQIRLMNSWDKRAKILGRTLLNMRKV